jgi:hypothetical protein
MPKRKINDISNMNRLDKIKLAIEKGFTCDISTGEVYGSRGKVLTTTDNDGYIRIQFYKNKTKYQLLAHQFIWYFANKEIVDEIDHINRIKNDNRIENLQAVTHQVNMCNVNAKGYTFNRRINKYQAGIRTNGKYKNLGYFDNEFDARKAYLNAKEVYHNRK